MAAEEIEPETTVNDSYSVTVPAAIREHLDIRPGDKLRWHVEDGRLVAEVLKQRYGITDDLEPVDVGETDAVEVERGFGADSLPEG